jgi:hypothetical protein
MGNAVWLFFALPDWYFSSILAPFGAGALSMIPAAGIICLLIGGVWGAVKRRLGLLFFLLLPLLSQVLVAVAGYMRGDVGNTTSQVVLSAFFWSQAGIAAYLVFRSKGARLPAVFLSLFCLSYAVFASFVASMSFGDVWL